MRKLMVKALRFTLIELLVVIAIIAVLAAMLMPALERARKAAQCVVCMSNLRQIHLGFQFYGNDSDGEAPYQPRFTAQTETCKHSPGSGWHTVETQDYVPFALLGCPSNNEPVQKGDNRAPGLHYMYRYNSNRALNYGDPHVTPMPREHNAPYLELRERHGRLLFDQNRTHRWLFGDAVHARRDGNGRINVRSRNWYNKGWSHIDGGHLMRHDGVGAWVDNQGRFPHDWYFAANFRDYDTFLAAALVSYL